MPRPARVGFATSLAIILAGACFFALAVSPAHADPVAPYLNPALEDPYWAFVSGQTWPDTFPAEWVAPKANRVSVAAKALPAVRALGTIGLAYTAVDIGWKIGRVIDTKWLHLGPATGLEPGVKPAQPSGT